MIKNLHVSDGCNVLFYVPACEHLYMPKRDLKRKNNSQRNIKEDQCALASALPYTFVCSFSIQKIIMKCCIFHLKTLACLLYETSIITTSCHHAPSMTLKLDMASDMCLSNSKSLIIKPAELFPCTWASTTLLKSRVLNKSNLFPSQISDLGLWSSIGLGENRKRNEQLGCTT